MKIEFKGNTISTLQVWEQLIFTGKKLVHWKKGRSAYSLADFILNRSGEQHIVELVTPTIKEDFILQLAHPEFEARFDKHGHGREHDLGIFGTTKSGKKIFIGIEAKVDESFGDTIAAAYHKAKAKELNGKATNAPKRIEELLKFNFETISESDFNLRYQLLFSTAGTLCVEADIHILLILVFKTNDYNPEKGTENHKDFINFVIKANAQSIDANHYQIKKGNKVLNLIYCEKEIN